MPQSSRTHLQTLRAKQPESTHRKRRTSKARGYTGPWRRLRLVVLERDHYLCQECGKPAGKSAHVHHIDGDSHHNELDNLQTLCHGCHSRETQGWTHGGGVVK